MSRTTVLLVGLMLVGLIVSPALAQTTVKFMDQHEGPDHPITPVPTYSNYSFLIQYDLMSPENYWRGSRQHIDEYNGWSTAMPRMDTGELSDQRANLFEFKDMIGSATDMYEETYVGQVPHGAVIISATLWLRRTNWGDATTNLGVYPVLDPDNLGHWGVNTDDPSWDPAGNGYKLGAGWVTRNSYPDGDPDIPWTLTGDQRIDDSVDLAAGTGNDFLGDSMEVKDMPKNTSDTWLVTDSVQNWVDCAGTMQGWMVLAATGDGEIFAG
ncbi:MAG: hypothetical protein KAV00_10580, partial [Phycisphaerae bacterium]|nr:hypothetical protein [Phycisphaerae bacterium]